LLIAKEVGVKFGKRDLESSLESELRRRRPEPPESFERALVHRLEQEGRHSRLSANFRRVAVFGFTALMLAVVAGFGGAGYAASSASSVVETAKRIVVAPTKQAPRVVKKSPANDQYHPSKVTICHRAGKHHVTITVSRSALPAHLAHGDTIGPCESGD
jgi:hypothetical protein